MFRPEPPRQSGTVPLYACDPYIALDLTLSGVRGINHLFPDVLSDEGPESRLTRLGEGTMLLHPIKVAADGNPIPDNTDLASTSTLRAVPSLGPITL